MRHHPLLPGRGQEVDLHGCRDVCAFGDLDQDTVLTERLPEVVEGMALELGGQRQGLAQLLRIVVQERADGPHLDAFRHRGVELRQMASVEEHDPRAVHQIQLGTGEGALLWRARAMEAAGFQRAE